MSRKRDWNWDGQFEDIKPEKPYKNPTKHNAVDTMLHMLKRFPGDKARALTDAITRVQKLSGRIPTFWEGLNRNGAGLSSERYDWLNCMGSAAHALVVAAGLE